MSSFSSNRSGVRSQFCIDLISNGQEPTGTSQQSACQRTGQAGPRRPRSWPCHTPASGFGPRFGSPIIRIQPHSSLPGSAAAGRTYQYLVANESPQPPGRGPKDAEAIPEHWLGQRSESDRDQARVARRRPVSPSHWHLEGAEPPRLRVTVMASESWQSPILSLPRGAALEI